MPLGKGRGHGCIWKNKQNLKYEQSSDEHHTRLQGFLFQLSVVIANCFFQPLSPQGPLNFLQFFRFHPISLEPNSQRWASQLSSNLPHLCFLQSQFKRLFSNFPFDSPKWPLIMVNKYHHAMNQIQHAVISFVHWLQFPSHQALNSLEVKMKFLSRYFPTNNMYDIIEVWLRNRIDMNKDVISSEKRGGHERSQNEVSILSGFQRINWSFILRWDREGIPGKRNNSAE